MDKATGDPDERFLDLRGLSVLDAMHRGLISCSPETPLRAVARMMATYRVHAVVVMPHGEEQLSDGGPWGVVSDAEVLRAAATGRLSEEPARSIAATPAITVPADAPLWRAAELMLARASSHVVVIEPYSTRPIGVLSRLDLARALAGFPERHPAKPARRGGRIAARR
jgi:CBS domain-containing protein